MVDAAIRLDATAWNQEPDPDVLAKLQRPSPVFIEVPASWCYRVLRPAIPGGWTPKLRDRFREGLFPHDPTSLLWDEAITPEGAWSVWAMPLYRLETMPDLLKKALWQQGRKVRIYPDEVAKGALADFPNLAPPDYRPRRWPWKAITRAARMGGGPLLLGAIILIAMGASKARWDRLDREVIHLREQVANAQSQVAQEDLFASRLGRMADGGNALWIQDVDALTRLLPEDTRLVSLQWQAAEVQIDLITPSPELIREILEGSPDFHRARLVGNLERNGALVRLTLVLSARREVAL